MAGSTFGNIFRMTTWGESHGKAVGVVVDGCPAGLSLCEDDIQALLDRRKPGNAAVATARAEDDRVEILSGIFEGKTTGTPISMLVWNKDQRSRDYSDIADVYRPGHADFCYDQKYGFRDYRGGGRSSGRETVGRVAAGAVAERMLSALGVKLLGYTRSVGQISVPEEECVLSEVLENPVAMPSNRIAKDALEYIGRIREKGDSVGGIVECRISGLPAGIGDPVFEKLDASLAKAVMSIGAVKGVEIGDGFLASEAFGSENNDLFVQGDDGEILKLTNHSGGTLGGMSDGSEIILRAAFKPTPSISREQKTVHKDGTECSLEIKGRHDPVIMPRAAVVVESMCAVAVADLMLSNMSANIDDVLGFYSRLISES